MRKAALALAATMALTGWGCASTTTTGTTGIRANPQLTSASVTFMTRDDGKDEDSAVAVQILNDGRLVAEGSVVDVDFDDRSVSAPLSLGLIGALDLRDLDDAQVRIRLTPDGRDTWAFDMRLTLGLSDGTKRNYLWNGLRLDESSPERIVAMVSGTLP
jgi:hypothetical protein